MYASKLHIVAPGEIAEAAAFVAANSEHTQQLKGSDVVVKCVSVINQVIKVENENL
jgi:hypothetical protein|tara:strand:+ start:257 stop:424 length:168 start_codon:yes stop_codon:yes gene_type:complete